MSGPRLFGWDVLRRVGRRAFVRRTVSLAVLLLLGWYVASRGVGMGPVLRALIGWTMPAGWSAEIGSVEGDWRSRMYLRGVVLSGPRVSITAPEVRLRFGLGALLSRTIDVRGVVLGQPSVEIELGEAPGSGDGTVPDGHDPRGERPFGGLLSSSPLGAWSAKLGGLTVVDGRVGLHTSSGSWRIADAHLALAGALDSAGLAIDLDSLTADVLVPREAGGDGTGGVDVGRLALSAELDGGSLRLERLDVTTSRTTLEGTGVVALVDAPRIADDVDVRVTARPLDLRDLPFRIPAALAEHPRVDLEVEARGQTADSVRLRARLGGPGTVEAEMEAVLRPRSGRSGPVLDAVVSLNGADLAAWSEPPFDGELEGRLAVTLDGWDVRAGLEAGGTFVHTPRRGVASGLLGRELRVDVTASRAVERVEVGEETAPLHVETRLLRSAGPEAADTWLEVGEVSARTLAKRADWSVDLRLDSAVVRGEGEARWSEPAGISVAYLDVERVDPQVVSTELPAASITGRLRGRVEGLALDRAEGRIDVELGASRFGGLALDSLTVGADVSDGTVRGRLMARDTARIARLGFRVSLSDSAIDAALADVHVAAVADVSGPSGDTASSLDLHGRATGRWVTGAGVRRGTVAISLDSSRVGSVTLRAGEIKGELVGERVRAEGEMRLSDLRGAPVRVRGDLEAMGTTLTDLVGSLELRAVRGGAPAEAGPDSLVTRVAVRETGRMLVDGWLRPVEGGRVVWQGTGSVSEAAVSLDLSARGRLDASTSLLGEATVDSLTLDASVAEAGGRLERLEAMLEVTGGRWRELTADTVRLSVWSDSARLVLDTLQVESNVLTLSGSGGLPVAGATAGRVSLNATLLDAEPVRRLLGADVLGVGTAQAAVTGTGTLDSIDVEAVVQARAIATRWANLTGLDAGGRAQLRAGAGGGLGLSSGSVDLAFDRLGLSDAEIRNVRLTADGGPDSIRVEASALVDDRRRGSLLVRVDPRPHRRLARIERLDFQLDEDEWSLSEPAVLSYRDGYTLDSFLLEAGGQQISIDGGVAGDGTLALSAQMDSTDIGTVSDLVGLPGLEGWLSGRMTLEGTTRAPEGRAVLRGGFHRRGADPGTARILLDADGRRIRGDLDLEATDGRLRIDGAFPLSDDESGSASDSLAVTVTAESFGLAWMLPFVDPAAVSGLEGWLTGEMTVRGSPERPLLDGAMAMHDGEVRIEPLGVELEAIEVGVHGDGPELVVDSARITSGSGDLRAAGTATLTGRLPFDLEFDLDDFQAIRNERYRADVSGDLRASGDVESPSVDGRLRIESLDVFLDERLTDDGLEEVQLTEEDLRMLRERFGYLVVEENVERTTPLVDRLSADLVVELGRDSWIRKRASPEMAVAFSGEVVVRLRPGSEPQIEGTVQTIADRGFIEQFGRRFELREGTVRFDGPPAAARLDLSATYTIPSHDNPDDAEATIVLSIQGTQDDLSLELSSEPPMENADIVSYIATGRPANGTLSFGGSDPDRGSGGGLVSAGANLALDQLAGVIEGAAAASVGLDVVEIRREGLRQATLVAGKYVSPRLYVGFAQPVTLREGDGLSLGGEGQSEVEIEFELLRWLLINAEGSGSDLRLFLRGRHAY